MQLNDVSSTWLSFFLSLKIVNFFDTMDKFVNSWKRQRLDETKSTECGKTLHNIVENFKANNKLE
jgi:hypothetical protein